MKEIKALNKKMYKKFNQEKKRNNVPESEYVTEMRNPQNIVEFDNLKTYFYTDQGTVKAVDGVTFEIPMGKTIGIVGESGCGKSVTSLSLMRLLQGPQGQISGGEIRYNRDEQPVDIAKVPVKLMQKIRGNEISMIFQEPMTSLNPVFTIGDQLSEILKLHNPDMDKKDMEERVIELLRLVGIVRDGISDSYPHELSGGMKQRVVIAMALACNPRLIIADEPTTALDVTIQAQILDLLRNLKDKINASIMLITHDLGVVAEMADYVVVMYAGRVVEQGTAQDIFHNPAHPYTVGLMKSRPVLNEEIGRLYSIPGNVPNPINMPSHCYFKNRCEKGVEKICGGEYPPMIDLSETHKVACYRCNEAVQEGGEADGN
ncbi:ABC transporter ATP-binding protein [Cuneatibacter caecimuris]|uniref:Peptide/nickel transport system ATP-binding protein n=1 Tax=Cuneatibacter caecimuris TaxID=1796618 RepID=A0A4Q7PN04_9FIRM|nr:ABC transporter ATP-binding protein [Cuneatibacter caecimuris]RZT02341.1 peptide/nickel transport system ATP-binding protein [Cuneatibacter caecimuris]